MPDFNKSAQALEFFKIVEQISQKCVALTGRERLKNARPIQDADELRRQLQLVKEMRQVYLADGGFPIWEFVDVRSLFAKIEAEGSYLEIGQFVKLQGFLELVEDIIAFNKKSSQKYPHLSQLIGGLESQDKLLNRLKFTFESSERIFDNASTELKAIRKEMARLNGDIHIRLERIMRKENEHIQEEYLTLRDGRLVLPVREFSVSKVPGIVHGQSGSGATYFVEPMSVVDLNNNLQKLVAAERKEIIKILRRLSALVRDEQGGLLNNLHILTELDTIQARARYANEFDCQAPEISTEFSWKLIQARHPVLLERQAGETVPLSLEIGQKERELIISGPNAGGKTVALKTVGILQLLFQSGFHVPVAEGSSMPICRQVFAVIGDEQSIENDLSTFSSHLQALQDILQKVDEQHLVLIDEIGNGTEPGGGAALAIAILEQLNRHGVVTIATTHQNQLKYFAAETEGVQNGAMQFDTEHLRPLFTLECGIPGSSYTFEICRRLGLDESIIERAAELAGKDSFELDKLLADVAESSSKYHQLRQKLSIKESQLAGLTQLYRTKSEALDDNRKKLEREARDEARKIVEGANREIERVVREIKESQGKKEVIRNGRKSVDKLKKSLQQKSKPKPRLKLENLEVGQAAGSVQFGIRGKISKIFAGKQEVELEKEGLKITIPASDLEIISDGGRVERLTEKALELPAESPGVNIHNELDLRGLMPEEAIREVERYLDAARLSNWTEVRLVHGKGTGALRKAVQNYLKQARGIKNYRIGKWGEGDSGVTVVEL